MREHLFNGVCFVLLALSGCSLAPEFQRPQMAIPEGWSSVATGGVDSPSEYKTVLAGAGK